MTNTLSITKNTIYKCEGFLVVHSYNILFCFIVKI